MVISEGGLESSKDSVNAGTENIAATASHAQNTVRRATVRQLNNAAQLRGEKKRLFSSAVTA